MKFIYQPIGLIVIICSFYLTSAHAHPSSQIVHSHTNWTGLVVIAAVVVALMVLNTMIIAKRQKT